MSKFALSAIVYTSYRAKSRQYRLRRVKDLFNITLDNPDDRLAVWMQLRLVMRD